MLVRQMTLKLVSDFRDYYDHWFDREGFELRRVTTEGPSRSEMFTAFKAARIHTPRHGLVKDMPADTKWMVVYLDESLHRGEGKILIPAAEAREKHPDTFCTEYLSFPKNEPVMSYKEKYFGSSWRELVVGNNYYFLHYRNCDDWRSNVGDDVIIELQDTHVGKRPKKDLPYPMYAIDYTFDDQRGDFAAIDLNIAPGIGGSPVEEVLPGEQVVAALKDWMKATLKGWIQTTIKPSGA